MIIVQNVSKKWGDRTIISDVSYHFPERARIALVGPNGTGKTTLLRILTKQEEYDTGSIVYPGKLRLGYMPQTFSPNPQASSLLECIAGAEAQQHIIGERQRLLHEMETHYSNALFESFEHIDAQYYAQGCQRIEHDALHILGGLGFTENMIRNDPRSLSGGWRMRLELAKILIAKPNFLILDEPTNHLDLPSIQFFEEYMLRFQGTLLFVSHDRDLVNRLANHTMGLRNGRIHTFAGNLDTFLNTIEKQNILAEKTRKNLQTRTVHMQHFVDRFRASPNRAKQVQSRIKALERLKAVEDTLQTHNWTDKIEWHIPQGTPSGQSVWHMHQLQIGYQKPLVRPLTLHVVRGWKVAIIGGNGLGKSTLLKTLYGLVPSLGGSLISGTNMRVGYFAQENSEQLDAKSTVLENVMAKASDMGEFQVRSLLGMLGLSGEDTMKKAGILSGGEKSRVALAQLWAQKLNTLLLDEPTNHLDMSSEEALCLALEQFAGTIIFVSHNRHFINNLATHTLQFHPNGRWTLNISTPPDLEA